MSDKIDDSFEQPQNGPRDPERVRKLPHLTQDDLDCILDEFGRKHYSMKDGRPVCGRLKKEKNRVIPNECCLGPPMANGACKVHGGRAGAPIRSGRYSRVLKTWQAAFERALSDQELLDSRRELALMDVGIEKLLERAEGLDAPAWREDLRETFVALRAAIHSKRQGQVGSLLKRLGEIIESGATIDQVARDLLANVDRRAARACKLTEIEVRRDEKVTVSELAAVFKQWLSILEAQLEPQAYHRVLPELRKVTVASRN